jgi:2'-5' RNA ligase
MHGIVSMLPQPFYRQVEDLWDELERDHGLRGIRVTPYPHFSWQIGEEYDEAGLELTLSAVAKLSKPFTVRTTGLGFFSGEQPVLFIPVVKSPDLVRYHQQLWKALEPLGKGINPYYNPQNWVPHISLAYLDLNPQNIGAVTRVLAFRTFNWEFSVENLVYIFEPAGQVGKIKIQVNLG